MRYERPQARQLQWCTSGPGSQCPLQPGREAISSRKADYSGRRDHHITCYRCGGNHLAPACKFQKAEQECSIGKKKGHIARMCKAKAQVGSTSHKKQPKRNHYLDADSADTPAEGSYRALFNVKYAHCNLNYD